MDCKRACNLARAYRHSHMRFTHRKGKTKTEIQPNVATQVLGLNNFASKKSCSNLGSRTQVLEPGRAIVCPSTHTWITPARVFNVCAHADLRVAAHARARVCSVGMSEETCVQTHTHTHTEIHVYAHTHTCSVKSSTADSEHTPHPFYSHLSQTSCVKRRLGHSSSATYGLQAFHNYHALNTNPQSVSSYSSRVLKSPHEIFRAPFLLIGLKYCQSSSPAWRKLSAKTLA